MSLTSANTIIQISVSVIFPTPQQLQKFSTDNIYEAPAITPNQVQMGVDGFQSAGKVFVSKPISYDLLADSPSNDFFDTWFSQEEAAQETFTANGLMVLKSVGKKFTLINGSLTSYTPLPPGGRILGPRRYEITWEKIIPAAA
jgi:hypothetical protein